MKTKKSMDMAQRPSATAGVCNAKGSAVKGDGSTSVGGFRGNTVIKA